MAPATRSRSARPREDDCASSDAEGAAEAGMGSVIEVVRVVAATRGRASYVGQWCIMPDQRCHPFPPGSRSGRCAGVGAPALRGRQRWASRPKPPRGLELHVDLVQRLHNPASRRCGCPPECVCQRSAVGVPFAGTSRAASTRRFPPNTRLGSKPRACPSASLSSRRRPASLHACVVR
jgi:hypothetical protein